MLFKLSFTGLSLDGLPPHDLKIRAGHRPAATLRYLMRIPSRTLLFVAPQVNKNGEDLVY
jgi:hypothetical protein